MIDAWDRVYNLVKQMGKDQSDKTEVRDLDHLDRLFDRKPNIRHVCVCGIM